LRIAFIAIRGMSYSGGIVTYTEKVAAELSKRGHDVTVYSSGHYGDKSGDYQGKFKVITIPAIKSKHLFRITLVMNASFHQMFCKYDLIHYHLVETSFWAVLAKMTGKKVVAQSHGIDHTRAKWSKPAAFVMRMLERISYPVADQLTVISKQVQRYYLEKYGKETVFIPPAIVMPEYAAPQLITEKYGLNKGGYYLFMARIVPEKGAHHLIKAYKKATTHKKLIIAGDMSEEDSYMRSLKTLAKDDERILFVGDIRGRIKAEFLGNAFAFILPSEMEGLCASLLEAMSYRTCCLVSDIPENVDVAKGIGFFFKNKDADDCARAIDAMERQPELMEKYRNAAYDYVKENYMLEHVVDQLEALYRSALGKNKK
jgi:glycosyltransferase involved in cell wall biosynthesis